MILYHYYISLATCSPIDKCCPACPVASRRDFATGVDNSTFHKKTAYQKGGDCFLNAVYRETEI